MSIIKKKNTTNLVDKNKIESPGQLVIRRLKANRFAMIGLGLLIFMFLFSFIGPFLSPYGPNEQFDMLKQAPSVKHLLGTDYMGRDVLTRLMYGGRISMLVGMVAVSISVTIGSLIGSIAGFYGGKIDYFLMAFTDIFISIPFLPVVILAGSMMSDLRVSPNMRVVSLMLMLGCLSWPTIARLVRGEILSLRELEFIQATESLGLRDSKKILKHLIPNVVPIIIVNATLGVASAILTESALSFLGMGVIEPTPSWGNMITKANNIFDLKTRLWLWIPPGLCMVLTVMSVNLLGDGLRDALDPKKRR